MKFDAVVGNPPYQVTVSDSGTNQHDMPIYHYFYDAAAKVSRISCLISPARFLTNAGYTPKDWNEKMLNDPHNKIAYYNINSAEVFPGVDIKGGVVIILHDNSRNIGPIGLFTPDETLTEIAKNVAKYIERDGNIMPLLFNQTKMNLPAIYAAYPAIKSVRPESHIRDTALGTDGFAVFAPLFADSQDSEHDVEILGLIKNKRVRKWIARKWLIGDKSTTKLGK